MDGAVAIRALCIGGGHCFHHGRAPESGRAWVDNRCVHLADELRNHREGTLDRDRGALCLALRPGLHLLAQLVGTRTIALADVDGAMDFLGIGLAGEGTDSRHFFLRHRYRSALAKPRAGKDWYT